MKTLALAAMITLAVMTVAIGQGPQAANETLWEAARAGDTTRITAALGQGADVNAKSRYDVTALFFAATNGRLEAVKLLVARGADVNAQDTFYRARAADMAGSNGHTDVVIYLLQNGADGDGILVGALQMNQEALLKAAVAGKVTRQGLQTAINMAGALKRDAFVAILKTKLDTLPAETPLPSFNVDPATLPRYAGNYRDAASGVQVAVTLQNGALMLQVQGQPPARLMATASNVFRVVEMNATLTFNERGGLIESVGLVQGPATLTLARIAADGAAPAPAAAAAAAVPPAPAATPIARPTGARNWPSFRGEGSAGNGDGQRAVTEWDVASGKNIKWKTPIPGVATSSPIVWGNRVFATTAISKAGDNSFRTGLYGDVKPVEDLSPHEWKIYSLDKTTGKVVWERTAATGAPKTKRHTKSSQASSTPATDGRHVAVVFGSAGLLVVWDFAGKELWRVDLGSLDSGWFFDPSFQWGHSSSPIIYRNSVILQADVQKGSYIAAWDIATGKPLWKTARADEISTWGTPAIARTANGRDELVTNGTKIRGYDPTTGKLLWTLGPNSEITIGTPVVGNGLVYVTGGYPPVRPIYAIRPGGTGDISLPKGQDTSSAIAWSNMTEGTYIPTPLVYDGYLFTLNINGIVTAYNPQTGQRAFRGRVGVGGAFSASPVGADGRLYIASEDGEVYVIAAASGLAQIAKNDMKEVIMATPAISDGLIVIRTIGHLYGIGQYTPAIHIDNPGDSRLADYRLLSDPELLRTRGLFVAEGRIVVARLLTDQRHTVRSLLLNPAAHREFAHTMASRIAQIPTYVCKTSDFAPITGFDIHRGCLALAERPAEMPWDQVTAKARTLVVLEGVSNADNVGGVFRNAAAFGADAVLLSPTCCDPFYRKAIRTSMAATLRVPLAHLAPWPDRLKELHDAGFTVVAFTPHEDAVCLTSFFEAARPARLALMFGGEGEGLTGPALQFAHTRVRIPIRPEVDSLNLAVAAGIALCWSASHGRAGPGM